MVKPSPIIHAFNFPHLNRIASTPEVKHPKFEKLGHKFARKLNSRNHDDQSAWDVQLQN